MVGGATEGPLIGRPIAGWLLTGSTPGSSGGRIEQKTCVGLCEVRGSVVDHVRQSTSQFP
jgi:hypothetical protein